jgi:hypothetical protein
MGLSVPGTLLLIAASLNLALPGEASDFDRLKQRLEGKWTFLEDKQPYETTFEIMSHGAALLERNTGFSVVYYPDGTTLMMTLFTKDGYQVRLRASGADKEGSLIQFAFQDATNLAPHAAHITGLTLEFRSRNHVLERWRMVDKRGTESNFAFELTRN